MTDVYVKRVEQRDARLGRQIVHDPRSRAFPFTASVDTSTWRTKSIRIYDPVPNPNQTIGNCTGCAKAMQLNAVGNRVTGRVLRMTDADEVYSLATTIDPWEGAWPPDDTGSSGLAAAKAAQVLGIGGAYRWIFNGVDGVVQAVMDGHVVNVGTYWYAGMFHQDERGRVEPFGKLAGGHEWSVRGFDAVTDELIGRCWWGDFRDFRIRRDHLAELLADDGDALVQARA